MTDQDRIEELKRVDVFLHAAADALESVDHDQAKDLSGDLQGVWQGVNKLRRQLERGQAA